MDTTDVVLGLVVLVVAGGALLLRRHRSPSQRARRLFKGVPRSSIAEARAGERIRVLGTVKVGSRALEAPVTGHRCVAFTARFEISGKGNAWQTRGEEAGCEEFTVVDETGDARVAPRPGRNRLFLAAGVVQTSDALEPGPHIEAFLARHGHLPGRPAKRFIEATIKDGDTVAILGRARFEAHSGSSQVEAEGYRNRPRRLVLEPPEDGELIISCMPSGG